MRMETKVGLEGKQIFKELKKILYFLNPSVMIYLNSMYFSLSMRDPDLMLTSL